MLRIEFLRFPSELEVEHRAPSIALVGEDYA